MLCGGAIHADDPGSTHLPDPDSHSGREHDSATAVPDVAARRRPIQNTKLRNILIPSIGLPADIHSVVWWLVLINYIFTPQVTTYKLVK